MDPAADLRAWKETLADLGVLGLVPDPQRAPEPLPEPLPAPAPPRVAAPVPAPLPRAEASRPVPTKLLAPPPPPAATGGYTPGPEALAGAESLDALLACTRDCMACPLGAGRLKYVFGEGHPKAGLMFIGEGPGRDEDLQGRPFVGKAGELLEKMIVAIGLSRQEVYIANVVKCRPPDNRTPLPDEAAKCLPILRRQIELIRPKVIVTLGATPLRELLGVSTGITRIRGEWQRLDMLGGIPVMPTFHPAYVLRQYTQDVRRSVWEDLKAARAWMDKEG